MQSLSFGENLKLITQLVRGLLHIHEKGVFHMDLKPENILVEKCQVSDEVTELLLCDFNSSIGDELVLTSAYATNTQQADFTQMWGSPEQLEQMHMGELKIISSKVDA